MQIISSTKTANRIPNKLLCLLGKKESLLFSEKALLANPVNYDT